VQVTTTTIIWNVCYIACVIFIFFWQSSRVVVVVVEEEEEEEDRYGEVAIGEQPFCKMIDYKLSIQN
jgi:hypothetical protein